MTLLLLQITNVILASSSAWIFFHTPTLWDDQAIVYSTLAGAFMACMTAIFLGSSMIFSENGRRSHFIHILLTLGFAGLQGYLLLQVSRNMGLIDLIKSRLGH